MAAPDAHDDNANLARRQERDDAALVCLPPRVRGHSNQELHAVVRMLLLAPGRDELSIVGLHLYHRLSFADVGERLGLPDGRVVDLFRSLQLRVRRAEAKRAEEDRLATLERKP